MSDVDFSVGLDADQAFVGTSRGVGVYIAEMDTAGPTDSASEWGADWTPLGYTSEDGITLTNAKDSTELRAWQSMNPIRTVITGQTRTVHMQLLQRNTTTMGVYWDVEDPEVTDGAYHFQVRSEQAGQRRALGLDFLDGTFSERMVMPRVMLSAVGDLQYQRSGFALYDVTFTILEGTDGWGLDIMGQGPPDIAPISVPVTAAKAAPSTVSAGGL
jgi:hypothetical protein